MTLQGAARKASEEIYQVIPEFTKLDMENAEAIILRHYEEYECSKDLLIYRAVRELAFIQEVENCHSGLCKTSEGKSIISDGMELLGIDDLSGETLDTAKMPAPPVDGNEKP
jgi:hypothetical protein